MTDNLIANDFIKEPPVDLIEAALKSAIEDVS